MADIMAQQPPLSPADDNPWYLIMTLHGEAETKNRVTWNRFVASALADSERCNLLSKARHPANELEPFSRDELDHLALQFAERRGPGNAVAMPMPPAFPFEFPDLAYLEFDAFLNSRGLLFPCGVRLE